MTLECPFCNTKYRLKKMPAVKVMATCKKCGQKFQFDPPDASKQITQQQEEKIKSVEETPQVYRQKGPGLTMVLILLIVGVATVDIWQLYGNYFSEEVVNTGIDNKINYWGESIPETIKINETQYSLVDDYLKWFSVLYHNRDFNAVEEYISDLLEENNEINSYKLQTLYLVLSKIPNVSTIDQMKNVLDEWCSIHSNSHISRLVRGAFHISYAWIIRGTGSAKTVKKKAWSKFREDLRLAKKDLEQSWNLNPNDTNSSSLLM